MTDPSLYSFSDDFIQQLLSSQQQPQDDSNYYSEDDGDGQDSEGSGDNDYEQQYNDLNDKYNEQQSLIEQLQQQLSYQQAQPLDIDSSEDPAYVTDFIYNNIIDAPKGSRGNGQGFQTFGSYEEGKNALINQLKLYQTGKTHNPVGPNSSLLEAMSVYAPASDNNDPNGYANFIAKQIGVSADTPISQIDTGKWANAIEKMEGNKIGNNPGNLRKYYVGGEIENYDIPPNFNIPIY